MMCELSQITSVGRLINNSTVSVDSVNNNPSHRMSEKQDAGL